jgi:tetratricopeptide (TPR) repeat protein
LKGGETAVARALFEAAIKLERRSGANKIQPRYLSYYGLTLMEDPARRPMALDCCRRAVKDEFFNADLFLNLSRVYLRLGNRAEAHKAAMRGLALDPKHGAIQQHLGQMGVRGRPPIPSSTDRTSSTSPSARCSVRARPGPPDRPSPSAAVLPRSLFHARA